MSNLGLWGQKNKKVLSNRWPQDKNQTKRTSNFSPSNPRKPCPLKNHKAVCKLKCQRIFSISRKVLQTSPYLILHQKLLPLSALLIRQGLSRRGVLTFHNACGCTWQRWCSQDYRLIHHKYVSIVGGLLSEKMAMGNSILHQKRFTVPGFSAYATGRRGQSVLEAQTQRSPNEHVGRLGVPQGGLTRGTLLFNKHGILLWVLYCVTLRAFSLRHLPV